MSSKEAYNYLKFDGAFLVPGFSVYLFKISKQSGEKYYYVGMTGDSFYASARSALHRLAGHIDKAKASTQNQFRKGLQKIFGKKKDEFPTDDELRSLTVELHHWAIPGFKEWESGFKDFDPSDFKLNSKAYKDYNSYKNKQGKVLELEQEIIYLLKDKFDGRCLNETNGTNHKSKHKLINEIMEIAK